MMALDSLLYGRGYGDFDGDIYLELNDHLILARHKNENSHYDIVIIDDRDSNGLSLLENISLREWREFFVKNARNEWKDIKRSLMVSQARKYADC